MHHLRWFNDTLNLQGELLDSKMQVYADLLPPKNSILSQTTDSTCFPIYYGAFITIISSWACYLQGPCKLILLINHSNLHISYYGLQPSDWIRNPYKICNRHLFIHLHIWTTCPGSCHFISPYTIFLCTGFKIHSLVGSAEHCIKHTKPTNQSKLLKKRGGINKK